MTELAATYLRLADYCLRRADVARASGNAEKAAKLEANAAHWMESAARL